MDRQTQQQLIEGVANENGIALYRQYTEKQAAHFLGLDTSTVRRTRRKGHIPHVQYESGAIRYLGYQIAAYIVLGKEAGNSTPDAA